MRPSDVKAVIDTIKDGPGSYRGKRWAIIAVAALALAPAAIALYVLVVALTALLG